jgi:hypothetical protein
VISLNLVLAGLRLGLKNRQVGEKWVSDVVRIRIFELSVQEQLQSGPLVGQIEVDESYFGARTANRSGAHEFHHVVLLVLVEFVLSITCFHVFCCVV